VCVRDASMVLRKPGASASTRSRRRAQRRRWAPLSGEMPLHRLFRCGARAGNEHDFFLETGHGVLSLRSQEYGQRSRSHARKRVLRRVISTGSPEGGRAFRRSCGVMTRRYPVTAVARS